LRYGSEDSPPFDVLSWGFRYTLLAGVVYPLRNLDAPTGTRQGENRAIEETRERGIQKEEEEQPSPLPLGFSV